MRCQRCEFENMPGLDTCMRCGSVLQGATVTVDVHPPRMPHWKKPIRWFGRCLRQIAPMSAWSGEDLYSRMVPDWLRKASCVSFFGGVLSIVPGLAHIIQKRLYTVRWWILSWMILLLAGLFFYGSTIGMILLGLAVGVHVWIALHSSALQEYEDLRARLGFYAVFMVLFWVMYTLIGPLLFYNIRGGVSAAEVPGRQIYRGDYLLGRVSSAGPQDIRRGDFVLAHLSMVGGHGLFRRNAAYVQIIGLQGEAVTIQDGQWVVDSVRLDQQMYPVPGWIAGSGISVTVPQKSYFVNVLYSGAGYNAAQAQSVCTIAQDRIQAKAFMRWNPLRRRGLISGTE